jgi:chromosome segregation ATPase
MCTDFGAHPRPPPISNGVNARVSDTLCKLRGLVSGITECHIRAIQARENWGSSERKVELANANLQELQAVTTARQDKGAENKHVERNEKELREAAEHIQCLTNSLETMQEKLEDEEAGKLAAEERLECSEQKRKDQAQQVLDFQTSMQQHRELSERLQTLEFMKGQVEEKLDAVKARLAAAEAEVLDLQDDLDTAKTELTETVQQQLRVLDEQKLKEREAIVGTSATEAQLQRQREALIQKEVFLQQRECELIHWENELVQHTSDKMETAFADTVSLL